MKNNVTMYSLQSKSNWAYKKLHTMYSKLHTMYSKLHTMYSKLPKNMSSEWGHLFQNRRNTSDWTIKFYIYLYFSKILKLLFLYI
jgi:hypothetical protein